MKMMLTIRQECAVCSQPLGTQTAEESRTLVRLLGSVPFAACPACGQAVTNIPDIRYINRAVRYLAEQRQIATCAHCEELLVRCAYCGVIGAKALACGCTGQELELDGRYLHSECEAALYDRDEEEPEVHTDHSRVARLLRRSR